MTIRFLPAFVLGLALTAPAHAAPSTNGDADGASLASTAMADKRARKVGHVRPTATPASREVL